VEHAARRDEPIAELAERARLAAEDEDLEAARVVEVHVHRADDLLEAHVLRVREAVQDLPVVVVVDDVDGRDRQRVAALPLLLDELAAHEVADPLRAVRVALLFEVAVELLEELLLERHGEADDARHGDPLELSIVTGGTATRRREPVVIPVSR
jgi:hypothetical protein